MSIPAQQSATVATPLEPNEQNLGALVGVLRMTVEGDGNQVKQASAQLETLEPRPKYSLCLLQLLAMPTVTDVKLKLASSIAFKNFILRNWEYEGTERQEKGLPNPVTEEDRKLVKEHIVRLMVSQPKKIQEQLGQALAIISQSDFPQQWPSLLPELLARFVTADAQPEELLGVLEVMHSIFYRYRHEQKSQKLWEEIAIVLQQVCEPLSNLFLKWVARLSDPNHSNNPVTLPVIIGILSLIVENFFSLNSQDIAAQFEDPVVLQGWMNNCLELLKYTNPILEPKQGADLDDPTKLDTLKATICDIINLFTWKYEDQFAPFVPNFVSTIWNLLTTLSEAKRFDHLVNSAIKFLTSVVKKEHFKALFNNADALKAICEKVIIPQLKLRESDLETFEENPQDYIRGDIEGGDADTRRRTSVDFIHGLTMHYEAQISDILKGYVAVLLEEYSKTKGTAKGFLNKDAAIYIILALSAKKSTLSKGVSETNPHVNVVEFFTTQIIPELTGDDKCCHAVIKADALKYLAVFRQQLPKEFYPQLVPIITRYLLSQNVVIHSYASYAIERLLSVKDRLDKPTLQPFLQKLLESLFTVLKHEESKENEYAMKAIMRVCSVGQDTMVPFAAVIIQQITTILGYVAQNPKHPAFNHSMFETIAALVKYLCKTNAALVDSFQTALFPPFQTMLSMESAAEFGPYVFQILSELLEFRSDISPPYIAIFPALLSPALWSNQGNVPAVARLLQAYIHKKNAWETVLNGKLEGILGIFQALLYTKSTEGYGLDLLTSVVQDLELSLTSDKLKIAFIDILFPRLQASKKPSPRLLKGAVVAFLVFISRHGFETVINFVDQVQKGLFAQLYNMILLPNMQFLHSDQERKLGAIILTNLLRSPAFLQNEIFFSTWARTLLATVTLINPKASRSLSHLVTQDSEEDPEDILAQSEKGFSTAYARLVFAAVPERDYVANVTQAPKDYFKENIEALCAQFPGKFPGLLGALPPSDQTTLHTFFQTNQVNLR